MQASDDWELAWNLLVGRVQAVEFWPAALLLALTLLSWPAWLACQSPRDRAMLRWGLGFYAFSRLMTDFVFWGPIVAGLATLVMGRGVIRALQRQATVKRPGMACVLAIATVIMTLRVAHWPVTQWAVCALLTGLVFPPIALNLAKPGTPKHPCWPCLWVGLMLSLPIDELTQRVYLPLVGLGLAGWVAYGFALWRRSTRKTTDPLLPTPGHRDRSSV